MVLEVELGSIMMILSMLLSSVMTISGLRLTSDQVMLSSTSRPVKLCLKSSHA